MAHVYRFEVVAERGRADGNAVYDARDDDDGAVVVLCEWSPPPDEWARAPAALDEVMHQLDGAEAFSSGSRLYVAASETRIRAALDTLRRHHLFRGPWPGLIDEPVARARQSDVPPPAAPAPQPPIEKPAVSTPVGIPGSSSSGLKILVTLLAVAAIVLVVYIVQLNQRRADEARAAAAQAEALKQLQREEEERQRALHQQQVDAERFRQQAIERYMGKGGPVDEPEAVRLFRQAETNGDPLAKMWLARSQHQGRLGFTRDENAAVGLATLVMERVRERANDNDPEALFLLASAYGEGLTVSLDGMAANRLYAQSCKAGFLLACTNLGSSIEDRNQAKDLYRRACDGDHMMACSLLGREYMKLPSDPTTDRTMLGLFTKACDGGLPRGCGDLGWMYEVERGVSRDLGRAASLLERGCQGGDMYSCARLGQMYADARAGKDDTKAVTLLRRACDGASLVGCFWLAGLYQSGNSVQAKDLIRSLQLYEDACQKDLPEACNAVGAVYYNAEGVTADTGRARDAFRKACDANVAVGCTNLGLVYEVGRAPVPRDITAAREAYRRGCEGGDRNGCEGGKRLIGVL